MCPLTLYLKNQFADDPYYHNIKTVFTIHNLKFQGVWDVKTLQGLTGFPKELFTPDKLEFKKDANMLKGGLVYADVITTVSDTYAEEIKTDFYGEGLDGLMKGRTVFIIAHRLSTVRNSNAILVLEQGKVVERGDHDDLLAQKGKYYQLYTNMIEIS